MCGSVYGKQNQEKLIVNPEKVTGKVRTMLVQWCYCTYESSGLVLKANDHVKKINCKVNFRAIK